MLYPKGVVKFLCLTWTIVSAGKTTEEPKVPAVIVPAFAIPPEAVKAPAEVKVPEPVVAIFPVVLIAISFAKSAPVILSENVVGGLRIAMFTLV